MLGPGALDLDPRPSELGPGALIVALVRWLLLDFGPDATDLGPGALYLSVRCILVLVRFFCLTPIRRPMELLKLMRP